MVAVFVGALFAHPLIQLHIPGSKNIDYVQPDFAKQVEELAGSKDRKIVVYCASLECDASPKAAKKLDQAGFTNVYDYEAGMKEWKDAELRVATGS